MVGLLHLGLLFLLLTMIGCAQLAEIEADPHFWPGAAHRLRRVPASEPLKAPLVKPVTLAHAPSPIHSSWRLVQKGNFSQREYELIVRDEQQRLVDTPQAPDMILDGDVVLGQITKKAPATWLIRLEYTRDQAVVKVGWSLGGHRLEGFRQMQFNLHEVDVFSSHSFVFKSRVRADGQDHLRVYVDLKDAKGYSIYSFDDFDIKLQVSHKSALVTGPFSTSSGPYFRITSTVPLKSEYHIVVDGEPLTGSGEVSFIDSTVRGPAAEKGDCLADLASTVGRVVPKDLEAVEAYRDLVASILRRYEEKREHGPDDYQQTLQLFSSHACTANGIWDSARDEAGRALKLIHQRLSR